MRVVLILYRAEPAMRTVGVDVVSLAAEVAAPAVAGTYCIEDPSCTRPEVRSPQLTTYSARRLLMCSYALLVGLDVLVGQYNGHA